MYETLEKFATYFDNVKTIKLEQNYRCTDVILNAANALIKNNPNPTKEEVRLELDGNICRCTGYQNIITAILEGAQAMRQ